MPRRLAQLQLTGEYDTVCAGCGDTVLVVLKITEDQADYSADVPALSGHVRAEFQHVCNGPRETDSAEV